MGNLIFKEGPCEKSDANKDDSENDSGIFNFHNKNHFCEIVDLRRSLKDKFDKNKIFCSFEIVSMWKPSTFYQRLLADMDNYSPLFYALTWHDNEAAFNSDNYLSLELAKNFPSNTLLHLAAKGLKRDQVVYILRKALDLGIINIFALQGDSSLPEDGDFKYAADLVVFIREQFGDTFCICVAGYPQMHPKSVSRKLDLSYLKAKVEAGADFIITQICFESQIFIDFVKDCRKIGIEIPILYGIFVPTSYKCFEKMANICKFDVSIKIQDDLARLKDDDQAVKRFAIDLIMEIVTNIIRSRVTCGFHLFTLNQLSSVREICRRMEILKMEDL